MQRTRALGLLPLLLGLLLACSTPPAATPFKPAPAPDHTDGGRAAAPAAAAAGAPAAPAREPLRIVYVTRDGAVGPLWLAEEAGIYARHGIDATLSYVSSGTVGMQALLAKEVDIGVTAASAAVAAGLGGADTVYIGAMQRTFGLWVISAPEIARPADLRGQRVGITRRNSTTDVGLQYYLRLHDLGYGSDATVVEVGEHSAMLAALQTGAIQASVTSSPTNLVLQRAGYRELADLTHLGVEYPMTALTTTRTLIAERRPVVERFMRAIWEASQRYKTDRDLSLAVLRKYLQSDDEELLGAVYDTYTQRLVQDAPRVYPEGTRTLLAELAATNPAATSADPLQFLDTSFQEQFDNEGLEAKLYGR